ncbi:hypothetical protein NML43_04400 [Rhodopseudomonas palustris]|uniref:hypothetical protein n=1 Tax=Rhodopseudomonas palustris TaxID=1076 RepID=UPI0020CEEA56|nr:hypothetical protein [Rhodopseudomonas palustris]MCP9626328.1 hypothetical protein [Rhodopseudomonas palustris]
MLDLVVLGGLPGLVLGIRYRLVVLLPVCVIGGLNILAIGLLLGESLRTALWAAVVACIALQVGYVLGSLIGMLPFVERRLGSSGPSASEGGSPDTAPSGRAKSIVGKLSLKK